jgi:hypothetical protein
MSVVRVNVEAYRVALCILGDSVCGRRVEIHSRRSKVRDSR